MHTAFGFGLGAYEYVCVAVFVLPCFFFSLFCCLAHVVSVVHDGWVVLGWPGDRRLRLSRLAEDRDRPERMFINQWQ